MPYLTKVADIRTLISKIASAKILWLDTEVADYKSKNPRLSLIQVLDDATDLTGAGAYILDVLDKHDLVKYFISQIMVNPKIEKLFHNANYDLRFLGNQQAQNVTCTLKMARKVPYHLLQVKNFKLKTLTEKLSQFSNIDKEEQGSDWGQRPLTEKQLEYANMDVVYLAQVHCRLLELSNLSKFESMGKIINCEQPYFTATKVRVAFECPRLFYLHEHFGGKTLFIPDGKSLGIGQEFHHLAEQFARLAQQEPGFVALFELSAEKLKAEQVAIDMQQLFYKLIFYPYLQKNIAADAGKAAALHQVWQGLTKLIPHWAELLVKNRHYCSAAEVMGKTFVAQEVSLEHWFTLPNGTKYLVKGQFDSLIFDCARQHLCVVDYKTYQPVDFSAQLAQVALYSYMLWEQKRVPVDSAVYCVLPELKEYFFSWEQLENTVHQLIPYKLQQMQEWVSWKQPQPNPPPPTSQPQLCQICPQQEKCQAFFGSDLDSANLTPLPPSLQGKGESSSPLLVGEGLGERSKIQRGGGKEGEGFRPPKSTINPDAIGKNLVATLQSFNINVDYCGAVVGSAFIRVKLKPHLGVKISSLLRSSADLQVQLGLDNPPWIAPQAGYVSVDLPRSEREIVNFEEYIQREILPATAPVKIAIGVNLDGQLVEADLSEPNTCHFLVGGTTGSGKSEFLRSLLLSIIVRHPPSHLKIALVDPKRVTFPEFEQMPWLYFPVVKESKTAIELMEQLVVEMEQRYRRFEQAKCADISAYNRQATQPLPRIVCIFDEYADLMAEKETREALEQSIKRLGAMARAAGIHLIIATQRPEAKVVTPLIRSNLPGRVALRTASEADSKIILGGKQTEAAYLLGKGDLLYQVGASLIRLQSLFARDCFTSDIG